MSVPPDNPAPGPEPEAFPAPVRYSLKPREFIAVNAPRGTEEKSAEHDVFELRKQVRAHEAAAGIGEVAPVPPQKNRRKLDFVLLLVGGNGLMLALFCVEIFVGFQVQCLAARMPGEINRLFHYALHEGRPMFFLPAACMTGYTIGLSWLMFGVMRKY